MPGEMKPAIVKSTKVDEYSKKMIWEFMGFLVSHPRKISFSRDIEPLSQAQELDIRFQEWLEAYEGALRNLQDNPHQYAICVFADAYREVYQKYK